MFKTLEKNSGKTSVSAPSWGMPMVEIYVFNITEHKEKVFNTDYGKLVYHSLVADKDCCGKKEEQTCFVLYDEEWESVREKGYYLG